LRQSQGAVILATMKSFISTLAIVCMGIIVCLPGCATQQKLGDLPACMLAGSADPENRWESPDSLPPIVTPEVDSDSLLAEDADWLLDSLSVPIMPLEEVIPDLPDISDSLAAATQAGHPTTDDLFDYPVVVNRRVLTWIDTFHKGTAHQHFERSLQRSGRYLAMARRIFREEGVPQDLVFLAHVESGFRYNARSVARALGLWQFMRGTAVLYGLRCDGYVDERLDPEKSTRAAAKYLKKLYGDFHDWYLALAAYNAGEGKVARAIERCGTRDFWCLAATSHLQNETRNFVPAILAATILAKSPGAYGLTEETEGPLAYDTAPVDFPTDLRVIAKLTGATLSELQRLNPALLVLQTPPDSRHYEVRVPVGMGDQLVAKLAQIPPSQRLVQERHVVKKGETLGLLARRYGTTIRAIQNANKMGRRTTIRVGERLSIPTRQGAPVPEESLARESGDPVRHVVRKGETLMMIAKRYGVDARDIQRVNHLKNANRISRGQSLVIPMPAEPAPRKLAQQEAKPADEAPEENLVDKLAAQGPPSPASVASRPQVARRMQEMNTSDNLGRVASTAHIVEQARVQIAKDEKESPPQAVLEPAPADLPPPQKVVHVVRKGETLSKIADRYGVRISDLRRWNKLGSKSLIKTGQRLSIVEPKQNLAKAEPDRSAKKSIHVVRRGESLSQIAKRYGLSVTKLAARNGIGRKGRIYPGQKIQLY